MAEFEQTGGTIGSHAREQTGHGATPDERGGGLEENIHRGSAEMDFRPLLQRHAVTGLATFSKNHVEVPGCDQRYAALENIALARLADLEGRDIVELLRKRPAKRGRDVLHDQNRREIRGE